MKVRVLKDPVYGKKYFKIGEIYNAVPARDGNNWMVESLKGEWLCMFPRELRFICPGVAEPN